MFLCESVYRKNHEYKKILIKNSTLKIKKMLFKKMLRKKMKNVGKKFWFKRKEDQIWVTTLRKMLSKKYKNWEKNKMLRVF